MLVTEVSFLLFESSPVVREVRKCNHMQVIKSSDVVYNIYD
jgi:hypothetical protein